MIDCRLGEEGSECKGERGCVLVEENGEITPPFWGVCKVREEKGVEASMGDEGCILVDLSGMVR